MRDHKKQQGWLMPMAAFIVVVMGLLAVGLSRIGTQSSFAQVQEQISIQAFLRQSQRPSLP